MFQGSSRVQLLPCALRKWDGGQHKVLDFNQVTSRFSQIGLLSRSASLIPNEGPFLDQYDRRELP